MLKKVRISLADAILNPRKYGVTGCALCGGKNITVSALYDPSEAMASKIGQPKGKKRFLVYGLCSPCSKLPDAAEKVEAEMVKHYKGMN